MRMKIAIVNRTNLKNYGSVLQVYALCQAVRNLGYDSEIIWESGNMSRNYDIRPNKIIKTGLKLLCHPSLLMTTIKTIREVKKVPVDESKVALFDEFVAKHIDQTLYSHDELVRVATTDKYDKFVCGSDQVWCTTTLYPDPTMYLRFAPFSKRIAYAPSLGRDFIPDYNRNILKKYINGVNHVSVREEDGQRLIKELTGRDVPIVADPTLLINSSEWDNLCAEISLPQKYILCYFLDNPSDTTKQAIADYATKKDLFVVALGVNLRLGLPENSIIYSKAGPAEFLSITKSAQMVITDSYHGMLFAINYHKNFWSVERAYSQFDQSSRQLTILKKLKLENRYLKQMSRVDDTPICYEPTQDLIDDFVASSLEYLDKSIKS